MWSREELKTKAKITLKRYYWIGFVVCLVTGILSGGGGSGGTARGASNTTGNGFTWNGELDSHLLSILPFLIGILLIIIIVSIAYSTFVGNPILVGKHYFFLASRENDAQFTNMFANFRRGRYMNTVKTIFLRDVFVFLWMLLLIIPGIIKSYQYFMVSYIMAENPEIETKRALEISKYMTNGDKFNIFMLQLSFIGWYLLGLLACCIGIIFVNPYYEATFAELYAVKREEAIRSGFSNDSELKGFSLSTSNSQLY